jgi:cytochrome c oxidase subunit 1
MSTGEAIATHSESEVHQEETSFIRTYLFSRDHKMIGKQFLCLSLFMLAIGGMLAMMIRWELAWPETPLPVIGASPQFLDRGEPSTFMDKTWQTWLSQDDT